MGSYYLMGIEFQFQFGKLQGVLEIDDGAVSQQCECIYCHRTVHFNLMYN